MYSTMIGDCQSNNNNTEWVFKCSMDHVIRFQPRYFVYTIYVYSDYLAKHIQN